VRSQLLRAWRPRANPPRLRVIENTPDLALQSRYRLLLPKVSFLQPVVSSPSWNRCVAVHRDRGDRTGELSGDGRRRNVGRAVRRGEEGMGPVCPAASVHPVRMGPVQERVGVVIAEWARSWNSGQRAGLRRREFARVVDPLPARRYGRGHGTGTDRSRTQLHRPVDQGSGRRSGARSPGRAHAVSTAGRRPRCGRARAPRPRRGLTHHRRLRSRTRRVVSGLRPNAAGVRNRRTCEDLFRDPAGAR
jgi:hypothetical protein